MSTAGLLWSLLFLFVLRVVGQLAVFLGLAPWLPPMDAWYSGLVPYGPLLAAQVVILVLYARACIDITRGSGYFAAPNARLGRGLSVFGWIYLGAMVARYAIRMTFWPEERWTGGSIPIFFFHWVLAAFLLVLARHHRRGTA